MGAFVLPSQAQYSLGSIEIETTIGTTSEAYQQVTGNRPSGLHTEQHNDYNQRCRNRYGELDYVTLYDADALGTRESVISAIGTYSIKQYSLNLRWANSTPATWDDYGESYYINCTVRPDEAIQRIHAKLWSTDNFPSPLTPPPPRRRVFTERQSEDERFLGHAALAGTWIPINTQCRPGITENYYSFSAMTGKFQANNGDGSGVITGDYSGWLAIYLEAQKQGKLYFRANGRTIEYSVTDWSLNRITIGYEGESAVTLKRCGHLVGITANDIVGAMWGVAETMQHYAGEIDDLRVLRKDRIPACAAYLARKYLPDFTPNDLEQWFSLAIINIFGTTTRAMAVYDFFEAGFTYYGCHEVHGLPLSPETIQGS